MTEEQLRNALDGLHAYDDGAVDSGIHDEDLRQRCINALKAQTGPHEIAPEVLSRIVRDLYLTDEAIAQGYGLEDAVGFIRWLDDRMGIQL